MTRPLLADETKGIWTTVHIPKKARKMSVTTKLILKPEAQPYGNVAQHHLHSVWVPYNHHNESHVDEHRFRAHHQVRRYCGLPDIVQPASVHPPSTEVLVVSILFVTKSWRSPRLLCSRPVSTPPNTLVVRLLAFVSRAHLCRMLRMMRMRLLGWWASAITFGGRGGSSSVGSPSLMAQYVEASCAFGGSCKPSLCLSIRHSTSSASITW